MLKKLFISTVSNTIVHHQHPWRTIANRSLSSASSTINSIVLRSLKEHYLEVAKMVQPPKVDPPSLFSVVKGSLDDASHGPVLRRSYGDEEISIAVTRLANVGEDHDDDQGDDINQLFLHVDVSKPGRDDSLQFLCGLYPDAIGIHAVSMRPKVEGLQCLVDSKKYSGPAFQDLEERVRDSLHGYIEERGVNEELFPFLQAWLYVRDHRNLMRWFKTVGTFVSAPMAT